MHSPIESRQIGHMTLSSSLLVRSHEEDLPNSMDVVIENLNKKKSLIFTQITKIDIRVFFFAIYKNGIAIVFCHTCRYGSRHNS